MKAKWLGPVGIVVVVICLIVIQSVRIISQFGNQPTVTPGRTAAHAFDDHSAPAAFEGSTAVEQARRLVPSSKTPAPSSVVPSEFLEPGAKPVISEFMANNSHAYMTGGEEYEDWIELHNPSTEPIDFGGYYLTDDDGELTKWQIPDAQIEPGGFLLITANGGSDTKRPGGRFSEFVERVRSAEIVEVDGRLVVRSALTKASNLKASFKLDAQGEYLALVEPNGKTIVHEFTPVYPTQKADISYGIANLGQMPAASERGYLRNPSPGQINSEALLGFLPKVHTSRTHGYCDKPFELTLSCPDDHAEIRYTTDGSAPTASSGRAYAGPLKISQTTVVRAAAFRAGYWTPQPTTASYLFLTDIAVQSPTPPAGYPQNGIVNSQRLRFGMNSEVINEYSPNRIVESLQALPALCISTSPDNLFDPRHGIYANPHGRGKQWERAASLELLNPDGSAGFQVDAGLRIRGGYSRRPRNPKHAFRMVFRSEYGASHLKFPLFGEEGTDEFEHIDFRTSLNYSWADEKSTRNTLLRDVFSRDTQRDMGQPYTRSRFYHLFLNGLYWGVYQTQERAVAAYAASYLGGKAGNYDVVKTKGDVPDGNHLAFLRYYRQVMQGVDDDAAYYRLQGLNPDGTPNENYEKFLDVDNLIDYMLITYYTGDRDGPGSRFTSIPNNYYSIYNRVQPDGWKYFEHDSEHTLDCGDNDMTYPFKGIRSASDFNPHWLHDQLVANRLYLKRFQERLDQHFGLDGALNYRQALARLEQREKELAGAIVAHSARWGSTDLDVECWSNAVSNIKRWMEGRGSTVYDQCRDRGWYPGPKTPTFSVAGSRLQAGFPVYLVAADERDKIYYTADGTDPRGADGLPTASARLIASATMKTIVLLAEGSQARVLVPKNGRLGLKWTQPDFFAADIWQRGRAPVGYEARSGYQRLIKMDLLKQTNAGARTSAYVRQEFELDRQPVTSDLVFLRMRVDDGFVAYLNGKRVASLNAPANLTWRSRASSSHSDGRAVEFQDFALPVALLRKGNNVLAVQALNVSDSSDFLMSAQIEARRFQGQSITIDRPQINLAVRAWNDGLWSALETATYDADGEL